VTEYIEPDDVDELVEVEGFRYRDRGLLLSALAAPLPVFGEEVYPKLHQKAAVLIRAINRDHPLLDGNKRLSWYVTVAFSAINGVNLRAGDPEEADGFIRLIAGGEVPLREIEVWLEGRAAPL
jgi:death-on-curing protein